MFESFGGEGHVNNYPELQVKSNCSLCARLHATCHSYTHSKRGRQMEQVFHQLSPQPYILHINFSYVKQHPEMEKSLYQTSVEERHERKWRREEREKKRGRSRKRRKSKRKRGESGKDRGIVKRKMELCLHCVSMTVWQNFVSRHDSI